MHLEPSGVSHTLPWELGAVPVTLRAAWTPGTKKKIPKNVCVSEILVWGESVWSRAGSGK